MLIPSPGLRGSRGSLIEGQPFDGMSRADASQLAAGARVICADAKPAKRFWRGEVERVAPSGKILVRVTAVKFGYGDWRKPSWPDACERSWFPFTHVRKDDGQ